MAALRSYCVTIGRGLAGGLRLLLLEHGLEVDFGQVHRREAAALDHVGHVAAQVGVDDLRAGDAEDRAHLVFRQVADLEDAGLLGLDQEHGPVLDLGLHGGRDGDLEDAVGHRLGIDAELDVDGGLLLLQQDGRRIGLFERQVLQVDALDLEHGILGLLVGHG